ncbi:MAG TPA: glycerophosphodiester phosphodiesterase family protein [Bacillota bacterium]|nr:glycerophosphodiester phosphodiesterase family protein [Bacillota bacterium]
MREWLPIPKTLHSVRFAFSAFFWFEVVYKLLGALVLFPLCISTLQVAAKKADMAYIYDMNFQEFIDDPYSIAMCLLVIALFVIYTMFEFVVLTYIFERAHEGIRITPLGAMMNGLLRFPRIVRPSGILLFFLVLAVSAFLNFPMALLLVTNTGIPEYFSLSFTNYPVVHYGVIGLCFLIFFFFGSQLFTICYMLVEKRGFSESWKRSLILTKNNRARIYLTSILWFLLISAVILSAYAIILILCSGVVHIFITATYEVQAYLTVSRIVSLIFSLIASVFTTPLYFALIVTVYWQSRPNLDKEGKTRNEKDIASAEKKFLRTRRRNAIILSVMMLSLCALNYGVVAKEIKEGELTNIISIRQPEIAAHRGSELRAPENSLESVELAIDEGAEYAEIDVQMTKDGVVVLMHDEDLSRVAGVKKKVSSMTYAEIEKLNIAGEHADEYGVVRIPTLSEVLELANGRIKLLVEIKTSDASPELPQAVADLIIAADMISSCPIQSFDYKALRQVKAIDPTFTVGAIFSMPIGFYADMNVDFYSIKGSFLTWRHIEYVHRVNRRIFVWGNMSAKRLSELNNLGVDVIITSDPVKTEEILLIQRTNPIVIYCGDLFIGKERMRKNAAVNWWL